MEMGKITTLMLLLGFYLNLLFNILTKQINFNKYIKYIRYNRYVNVFVEKNTDLSMLRCKLNKNMLIFNSIITTKN
jgi:hypothetical protein